MQISFSNNRNSTAFLQDVPGGTIGPFPQVWRVWEQGCWRAASSVTQVECAEDSASVWGQQCKEGKGKYFIFAEDLHSQPFTNIHIFSPEKQWSAISQVNSCLWCCLWDVVACTGCWSSCHQPCLYSFLVSFPAWLGRSKTMGGFVCFFSKGLQVFVLFKNLMFPYIESLENKMYSLAVASQWQHLLCINFFFLSLAGKVKYVK